MGAKIQPTQELMDKVAYVADLKASLPFKDRGNLNACRVFCRVNNLPGNARYYQAGGKWIARLKFTLESDRQVDVHKYKPGDWERDLDDTFELALTYYTSNKALQNAEGLEQQEQAVSEYVKTTLADSERARALWLLATIYSQQERYEDELACAQKAVDLDPDFAHYHLTLSALYFTAMDNSLSASTPRGHYPTTGCTLDTLGCTYGEAYRMVEEHANLAIKFGRNNRELVKAAKNQLTDIRLHLEAITEDHGEDSSLQGEELELENLLKNTEDPVDAVRVLREYVRTTPSVSRQAQGLNLLTFNYTQLGRFKDACDCAEGVVELAPDVAMYHFNLSTLYFLALGNSTSVVDVPEDFRGCTLDVLGCTFEEALDIVREHASEALKLGKHDRKIVEAAKNQLESIRHLRML